MKKTGLLLLTSVICLLFALSGCGTSTTASSASASDSPSVSSTAPSTTTDSSQKVFTTAELAKYNGQNGAKAYVAVNGVVYDVSNAKNWVNGAHEGHSAGQDLSSVINQSPHGTSVLSGLPVVGTLK